jgi:hypothetical protein
LGIRSKFKEKVGKGEGITRETEGERNIRHGNSYSWF